MARDRFRRVVLLVWLRGMPADCPVCMQLMYDPVTLVCGHMCCRRCLAQWLVMHSASSRCPGAWCSWCSCAMDTLRERCRDGSAFPVPSGGCSSPIPRSLPKVTVMVREHLEERFPVQYAQRRAEVRGSVSFRPLYRAERSVHHHGVAVPLCLFCRCVSMCVCAW